MSIYRVVLVAGAFDLGVNDSEVSGNDIRDLFIRSRKEVEHFCVGENGVLSITDDSWGEYDSIVIKTSRFVSCGLLKPKSSNLVEVGGEKPGSAEVKKEFKTPTIPDGVVQPVFDDPED